MNDQTQAAISDWLDNLTHEKFRGLVDERIIRTLTVIQELVQAHAAAIWLKRLDADSQVIAINVGDRGSEVEGKVEQPLGKGLVSKAFNEQMTICDQGIFVEAAQSDLVDQQLGQMTVHQICTPYSLFGRPTGTMTAIQTLGGGVERPNLKWEFEEISVKRFEVLSQSIAGLLEANILRELS